MTLFELLNPQNLVFENYTDKSKYMNAFMEESSNPTNVTNKLIEKLYASVLDRAKIDYDKIPESKGKLVDYEGYDHMVGTLSVIEAMCYNAKVPVPESVKTVQMAINNIVSMKDIFTKGFSLNKEFIILQYNLLVSACVTATSTVLISYVDYLRNPEDMTVMIKKTSHPDGKLLISNLNRFNKSVVSGEYVKLLNTILTAKKTDAVSESVVKEDFWVIPLAIVGVTILAVALMRSLVFYFFYLRTKLSEELMLQSTFLELNTANVQSKNISSSDKKEIVKKQLALSKKLRVMAERIRVQDDTAEKSAVKNLEQDNATWKLDEFQDNNSNTSGYQML